ncbi:MAG: 50S ribosomal protein L4 [Deltaproteobacteria bacterium]|nr:50S ribosomal protein L4 [Deltaproteobacteria bacterium]
MGRWSGTRPPTSAPAPRKPRGRGEVSFSGSKLYRQKGTGRARSGSSRSGVRVGGGHIHSIDPKDWSYKVPKKVRRAALASALSHKLAEEKLTVIDGFGLKEIKTKAMAKVLAGLGVSGTGLIVTGERDEIVEMSTRNIPTVKVLPAEGLNVYDLLRYDRVILTKDALEKIEGRFAS